MIKAVIFDCFGVLVQGTLEAFHDQHNFTYEQRSRARELEQASSRGYLSYEDHLEALSEIAGITVEQTKKEVEDNPPNEKLLDFIEKDLKQHYKIGFLSNASSNWLDELFTPEQQSLFDDVVLSYQVNMAKPDVRIFELTASNLMVELDECIFIDDIERYCEAAEEVGMKSICYKNFAQFERDIINLLQ